MTQMDKAVWQLLVHCCHEWVYITGGEKPLDEPEMLAQVPGYFVPGEMIAALAVAHNAIMKANNAVRAGENGPLFPAETVNLDTLPQEPDPE
jgi:hypothetical protein